MDLIELASTVGVAIVTGISGWFGGVQTQKNSVAAKRLEYERQDKEIKDKKKEEIAVKLKEIDQHILELKNTISTKRYELIKESFDIKDAIEEQIKARVGLVVLPKLLDDQISRFNQKEKDSMYSHFTNVLRIKNLDIDSALIESKLHDLMLPIINSLIGELEGVANRASYAYDTVFYAATKLRGISTLPQQLALEAEKRMIYKKQIDSAIVTLNGLDSSLFKIRDKYMHEIYNHLRTP